MNLLCAVTGHRWRVDDSSTGEEMVFRCTRCGKQHHGVPGGASADVSRGGSFTDAQAASIAEDLHRNDPHG